MRPLDRFSSIKIKLGILVTATVTLAALFTWIGLYNHLGPTRTLPLAIVVSVIARGRVRVGPRWLYRPIHVNNAARVTVAVTRIPSLILIEENRSSGRMSGSRPRPACRGVLTQLPAGSNA